MTQLALPPAAATPENSGIDRLAKYEGWTEFDRNWALSLRNTLPGKKIRFAAPDPPNRYSHGLGPEAVESIGGIARALRRIAKITAHELPPPSTNDRIRTLLIRRRRASFALQELIYSLSEVRTLEMRYRAENLGQSFPEWIERMVARLAIRLDLESTDMVITMPPAEFLEVLSFHLPSRFSPPAVHFATASSTRETKDPTLSMSPGFFAGAALADTYNVAASRCDAFLKKLERSRASLSDACWIQDSNPARNSPKYYYRQNSAEIETIAARYR